MIRDVRPGPRLLPHLTAWTFLGVAAAFWGPLTLAWAAHGALLLAFLALDLRALVRIPDVRLDREVAASLALGAWAPVRLRLVSDGERPVRLALFDHYPAAAELKGLPAELELAAGGTAEVEYRIRPRRRGDVTFGRVEVLVGSPAALWRRRRWRGAEQRVKVLPNFKPVARYALLALSDRLGQMGIRVHQRRGEGLEFHELREYRQGDSQRRIDWKATARRQTLISREYEEEKNQQVLLLVDCGRRMRALDGDLTHFDHVLNAVLLLTWVALRQGDAVGLMTLAGDDRWLPPRKGQNGMSSILRSVYDLETSLEPPDYLEAATRLMGRQRRRALVVLMTNLRDEDATELVPALGLLRTRNLVLLASLRETVLREVLAAPPVSFQAALTTTAAHRYLEARQKTHEAIRGRGVLTLDVEPDRLAIQVVNRYLDVKRSGLL